MGKTMKISAWDLGSTFAFAGNLNGYRKAAHFTVTGARPEKLAKFWEYIDPENGGLGCYDVVIFERPFARGQAATRMLWGMAGLLEAAAHASGVAVLDATPGEIKKWATGDGQASKEKMLAHAARLGYSGTNEHEADAWCLLRYAEANITT